MVEIKRAKLKKTGLNEYLLSYRKFGSHNKPIDEIHVVESLSDKNGQEIIQYFRKIIEDYNVMREDNEPKRVFLQVQRKYNISYKTQKRNSQRFVRVWPKDKPFEPCVI